MLTYKALNHKPQFTLMNIIFEDVWWSDEPGLDPRPPLHGQEDENGQSCRGAHKESFQGGGTEIIEIRILWLVLLLETKHYI